MSKKITFSLFFLLLSFFNLQAQDDLRLLADMMIGSFDSEKQSLEDTSYYNINLEMVEIWEKQKDAPIWLYVEQAVATKKAKPYRQRIYKLVKNNDETFSSYVYEFKKPERVVGMYKDPAFFENMTMNDISLREGCEVVLKKTRAGYMGKTAPNTCKSTLRGASYATSVVTVMHDRIVSWDRGFDENDEQVWGATKGGYTFMKKQKTDMQYPKTMRQRVVDNYFGTTVSDPYRWLEDENSEETKNWVKAQNTTTYSYLENIPYREKIKERLTEIWNYPKESLPQKEGGYTYYTKNSGLQAQSILYQKNNKTGEEKVFLDPNKFSTDGTVSLAGRSFSKNGEYMAYSISKGGSDWREIFVLDTKTGQKKMDFLKDVKFSGMAWYKDGFFYNRYDKDEEKELSSKNEFKKLYYHKIGTKQSEDKLIFEDLDKPQQGNFGYTSKDEKFLFLNLNQGTSYNAMMVAETANLEAGFKPIVEDFTCDIYSIGNDGDDIFLLTNRNAPNWRLIKTNFKNLKEKNWVNILPETDHKLQSVEMVGGKLVAKYMRDVVEYLEVYDLSGKKLYDLEMPGKGTVGSISAKKDDPEFYYSFTSYVYPTTIFKYNLDTKKSEIYRKSEAKFNPDEYVSEQLFFESNDGTQIPMFVTHKKGIELDGNNPVLLYGYGGFDISIKPQFDVSKLVFLEKGGVYAVVTLRGGSEYGEKWHKAGMLLNKQNVFDDYIGAAEFLIEKKYTNPDKIAVSGRSNGGLLVGAVMTQRPDLYKVALPAVGVLDMLRYHKFTIGWAWAGEYGDSETEENFKNIYQYSPLHNLKTGTNYPATLVTTADHDDRVVPAHSYKFISELQHCHEGENPVMIRIDTEAGHGYGKSTQQYINENADIMSFIFWNLGVDWD